MKKFLLGLTIGLAFLGSVTFAAGVLQVIQGGTGATTLTGCLEGHGTSAFTGSGLPCGSGSGGSSPVYPFTQQTYGQSTSTTVGFLQGLFSVGSTTVGTLNIPSLSNGVIKVTLGVVGTATNGTDYTLITATDCTGIGHLLKVTAAGIFTCSSDTGGGGAGTGTVSTTTPLVSGQVDFSTGVSTIGNDSTFLFDTVSKRLTFTYSTSTYSSSGVASSTNFIGGGLGTCTGNNFLQYTSGNFFSCAAGNTGTLTAVTATWPLISSGGTTPNLTYAGFGTTTDTGIGNDLILYTSHTGIVKGVASSSLALPNTALQNSTISGVALGGTLTSHSHDTSLTGTSYNGSATVSDWGLALNHTNTWSVLQNFNYSSSSVYSSFNIASTTFLTVNGESFNDLTGTGLSIVGNALTNAGVISLGNGTGTTCSGTNPGTCNVNTSQNITTLSNLSTNGLVTTSGSNGTLGVTVNGTGGFVLAMANGIPTWVATTTFSGGLTYLNGNVTNSGVTSIIAGTNIAISGATGAVTISASNPFEIATTSDIALAGVAYITKTSGKTTIGSVATGTVSAGSSAITVTAGRSVLGGALAIDCATSGSGQNGCLSSTDWTTFNNKLTTVSVNSPLGGNGTAGSPLTCVTCTGTGSASYQFGTSTDGYVLYPFGQMLAVGTTTSRIFPLTIASSTVPQLALGSGSATDAIFVQRVGGNSFTIATVSPQTLATTSTSNIFSLNQNGALCIGLGCSPMTTSGLYIRDQEGTGPTLYMGGNPGGDTDWQIKRAPNNDTVSNDRLGFGIGDIGNNPTEILTLNSNYTVGIGTTTSNYGLLTLASSTVPQLILGDGVAGNGKLAFRLAGGYMYLGTTTAQGLATSSPPIEVWNPNGFLGIGGTTTPGSLFSINNVANFDPATSTFSSTGGINLARGCFSIAGTCIGNVTAGSGLTSYDPFTHAYGGMSASSSLFAFGTTTSRIFQLTVASSTVPQLSLGDGIAGNPQYTMRTAGGNFYLGTTTVQGLATTTVSALTIINNGGVGLFDTSPDFLFETTGKNTNGYFGVTNVNDGDIFDINNSGFVGIGTTTPPSLLTLNPTNAQLNSVNPLFQMGTSTLSGASSSGTYLGINSPNGFAGDYFNIQNNNTTAVTISQSASGFGVFRLGTTTNSSVPGKEIISTSTTPQLTLNDGLGGTTPWNLRSVGNNFYLATSSANSTATSTTASFSINSGGVVSFGNYPDCTTTSNAVAIVSTQVVCHTLVSDERLKTDINVFTHGLDIVLNVQPKTWLFKDNHLPGLATEDTSLQYGFIAQDIEKYAPELVSKTTPSYLTPNGTKTYNPDEKIVILWNAVREIAQAKGFAPIKRSVEENYQWGIMAILAYGWYSNRKKINKLEKLIKK